MAPAASASTLDKRRRMLEAARKIIVANGLKGTTMEAIAAEAGVAKGTLYAYFADKDAVFEGLIETLLDSMQAAFSEAFIEDGPIAQRVARGLAAKFGVAAEMIDGSPHANELMGEHHCLAPKVTASDTAIAEEIASTMTEHGIKNAEALVKLMLAACAGILAKYEGAEEVRAAVTTLCERLVAASEKDR